MATKIFSNGFGFGETGGTSSAIDTTGCDFFWIGIEGQIGATPLTVSDSKGNTWHALTKAIGAGFTAAVIYWCIPTSVGTGHTFTFTTPPSSGSYPGCFVSGYHGIDQSSPLDHDAGTPGNAGASNTWTPGAANCLVVGIIANYTSSITSVASPLILDVHQPLTGGVNYDGAIAHVIQTTAVPVVVDFTAGGYGGRGSVAAASFKAAVSATNIPVPLATMTTATFAPTLNIPVPTTSLGITTYAPAVYPIYVSVPNASLALTTYPPLATGVATLPIPAGSLSFATYAPTVLLVDLGVCAERFGPKFYYWEPSYLERPEDTFLRATDWENAGYQGLKFVQGFILEADTEGATRQIKIQGDQADIETITINHNGQIQKPYSLNQPVQKHLLRILPADTNVHWRLFGVRWVYEPAPEFAKEWKTQGTDHDLPGYSFLKDGYIAHNSTVDITLNITVDGSVFTYTIPNSGGVYKKDYILFAIANSGLALKGTLFTYELTSSAPFQLFQKDSEVRVHAWAGGDYMIKLPFGDIHRESGARI